MILTGDPPIDVTVKRSARARRISLRVSQLDGRVTLTLPSHLRVSEANDFVREKETWLRRHLQRQQNAVIVAHNQPILLEGREVTVVPVAGRAIIVNPDTLGIPGNSEQVPVRVRVFLKNLARDRLAAASDFYVNKLGLSYSRITLRDTRSRWGSCTAQGNLMYSWRLIMAPASVLNYVAAHEVAHLVQMNHSPAFWQVVATLNPDYKSHRSWLRVHGAGLHRYRFGD